MLNDITCVCVSRVDVLSILCSLVQIKCDQYWPGRGTDTYGAVQVTLLDTMELATFCVRTFSLHKVKTLMFTLTLILGRAEPRAHSLSSVRWF